jgi:hypothetical protein
LKEAVVNSFLGRRGVNETSLSAVESKSSPVRSSADVPARVSENISASEYELSDLVYENGPPPERRLIRTLTAVYAIAGVAFVVGWSLWRARSAAIFGHDLFGSAVALVGLSVSIAACLVEVVAAYRSRRRTQTLLLKEFR